MNELAKLQAQIAELQKQAEVLTTKHKAEAIEDIKVKIKAYGITAKDVGLSGVEVARKLPAVPIKYRHPQNHDLAWTGRGRQPKWMEAYLHDGGSLEQLLV